MRNRKLKFAIGIVLLVLTSYSLILNVKATDSHAPPALWLDPSSITIDVSTVDVGYKFNITAWVNITGDSFMWQIQLNFNTTYINATRAAYTGGSTSIWAVNRTGGGTVPITPVLDNVQGTVLAGESCLGSDYVPGPVEASLEWFEFALKAKPPADHLTINFSTPYGIDTFVASTDLTTIEMNTINGTDFPIVPEFPSILILLIAMTLSTASIVSIRKLKR